MPLPPLVRALDELQRTLQAAEWADVSIKRRAQALIERVLCLPDGPEHIGRKVIKADTSRSGTSSTPFLKTQWHSTLERTSANTGGLSSTGVGAAPVKRKLGTRIGTKGSGSAAQGAGWFRCACGSPVKEVNEERHKERCAAKGGARKAGALPRAGRRPTHSPVARGHKGRLVGKGKGVQKTVGPLRPLIEAEVPQPNLDATTPYAHAFREHGRFGSHSGHDDYSEDAGA